MIWYVILALVGAPVTLFLHESSHALVARLQGAKVISFKPWPHMVDGWLYFGRMIYMGGDPTKLVHAAPALKAAALCCVWGVLAWQVWAPLVALAAWEGIDFVWWWVGAIRGPTFDAYKVLRK